MKRNLLYRLLFRKLKKAVLVINLSAVLLMVVGPIAPAHATINAGDHFTMVAAGSATTLSSGGSLTFTIQSLNSSNAAKALNSADRAFIEIINPATFQPHTQADITAVGAGLSVVQKTGTGGVSMPYPLQDSSSVAGTIGAGNPENAIAVNIADGTSASNTFTVSSLSSFDVFVYTPGGTPNTPADASAGQDFRSITVAASSGAANNFGVTPPTSNPKASDQFSLTVTQRNSDGGKDTTANSNVTVNVGFMGLKSGAESATITSSAAHNLVAGDLIKMSGLGNANQAYVVSLVPSSTTFKVLSVRDETVANGTPKVTPLTASAGPTNNMGATPGSIQAKISSNVAMSSTSNINAGDVVTIAGCTGNYLVRTDIDTSIAVLGINACTPTANGAVTKVSTSDGTQSSATLSNETVYIAAVNGIAVSGTTTRFLAGQSLVSGEMTVTVVAGEAQVMAFQPTATGLTSTPVNVTIQGAAVQSINGYGPPNGQSGVSINAPVDVMFGAPLSSVTFPLTNSPGSVLSLVNTLSGAEVPGQWRSFTDTFGGSSFSRVSFLPNSPLSSATQYTAKIAKSLTSNATLPGGMPALTDGGTTLNFSFTAGEGGGNVPPPSGGGSGGTGGGGIGTEFSGTQGGEFPPMTFLSYPKPDEFDVATNIQAVVVEFDRDMDATTFASNVYIKKLVNGVESGSLPAGTVSLSPTTGVSNKVFISGYTFEANSDYRVIVERDVKSVSGDSIAGMPESSGSTVQEFGFGFANMGNWKEKFRTGTGSKTITANFVGTNLDKHLSSGSITNVPTSIRIKTNFDKPLNPANITAANVRLKKNGTLPVPGTLKYDGFSNGITFIPSTPLTASTSYTFDVTTAVTSITGQAIAALQKTFTTGAADTGSPSLVFADCDNYGCFVDFDEALNETSAEDLGNYSVYTCSSSAVSWNGSSATCTGGGSATSVSLLTGVNARYDDFESNVRIDGVTLTAASGFLVVANVPDVTGNAMSSSNYWTGFVMDAGKFFGGQGMFQMESIGFDDFNMKDMGFSPVSVMPANTLGGVTTKYFADVPISAQIPSSGYIVLTFPSGFTVTGAKRDAQSQINADFNGPTTGSPTFATAIPTGYVDGAVANDGVGIIASANKVVVQLSAATQATDFLTIDLDGITNTTESKTFGSDGFQVDVRTFNSSGALLEALTAMPFFISSAGDKTISGRVLAGSTGLNGVKVFMDSWVVGFQEATTANNAAGGGLDGEYKFTVPAGDFNLFTEPSFTVSSTEYRGVSWLPTKVSSGNVTQNLNVTALSGGSAATQKVVITFAGLSGVSSLGFNDSIDVFASGPQGFVLKTLTRSQLSSHIADPTANPITLYLPSTGTWNIGIGPAMPKGQFAFLEPLWMPPQNQNVNVKTTDIGGTALPNMPFTVATADKAINGIVKDSAGSAVTSGRVFAQNTQGGFGSEAKLKKDGTFSIPVGTGIYKVQYFGQGLPPSKEYNVNVDSTGAFNVEGNSTASTGTSGANPFAIAMKMNVSNTVTLSGRVTDGTNAIAGAGVWAHRTDQVAPPVDSFTDESGNYILYVPAASSGSATWSVEAFAPSYGMLGSKSLTVTTESYKNQDFQPADTADLDVISGTIDVPGTTDDSGVVVWAFGPNGGNEAVTKTDGTYSMSLPAGSYTVEAFHPQMGGLIKTTQTLSGSDATVSATSIASPSTFTVSLPSALADDTFVELIDATGKAHSVTIPAGETEASATVPQGAYTLDFDVPFSEASVTPTGAEFNSTTGAIDIDGTGDDISLTLPTLRTISGSVTETGSGVGNINVSIIDESTDDIMEVQTNSSGVWTATVPDGNYSVFTDPSGFDATPLGVTVSGANSANNNFALAETTRTVTGTIKDSSGAVVEGALVIAQEAGGQTITTETAADGTYTLYVDDTNIEISAIKEGFAESSTVYADTRSANDSGVNVTLPSTAVALEDPISKPVTANSGGTVSDSAMGISLLVPANSLDTSATITVEETNLIPPDTDAGSVVGATGIEIAAKSSSDGTPITELDEADLSFTLSLSELTSSGVVTYSESEELGIGYLDDGNWTMEATDTVYLNSSGVPIAPNTVASAATLQAAGVSTVQLHATINHFTTFAPINPSGATPPAQPAGVAVTAGSESVTLTWTKNSETDMSSYDIWENNITQGVTTTLANSLCTTTCSKSITGLSNGTAYSFQVVAVDSDGNKSAGSSAVSASPSANSSNSGGSSSGGTGSFSVINKSNTTTATDAAKDAVTTGLSENAGEDVGAGDDGGTASGDAAVVTAFVDVNSHWSAQFVVNLYDLGIVKGYDATHYGPDKNITRAEFIKIVVEAFDIPVLDAKKIVLMPFIDVDKGDWYLPYAKAALKSNLVAGYADGTFKPNNKITRAEALKILFVATKMDVSSAVKADFSDVDQKAWYAQYVNFASANGVVNGYGYGKFGPNNNLTRAEVAKIVSLMLEKISSDAASGAIGQVTDLLIN